MKYAHFPEELKSADPLAVAMIDSRYEFQERQAGGLHSGVVYRARRRSDGQILAIRIFRPFKHSESNRDKISFARYLYPTVHLVHRGLVRTHEVVTPGDDLYVVVMDFVDGPTLSDVIREKRLPSFADTVEILRNIASALSYAHAQGFVCHHLSPGMIKFPERTHPVLVDLGVTVRCGVTCPTHFVAPGDLDGQDPRADVYSFGVLAYSMSTGSSPFENTSFGELYLEKKRNRRVSVREVVPGLPRDFDKLIAKCIRVNPDERYSSMGIVERELEKLAEEPEEKPSGGRGVRVSVLRPLGIAS